MSERPFMQLYVSDFIGDTLHLSTEQIGAYMLMLMAMWNAGGSLPEDEAKLARVVRMSVKKWRAIAADILPFFAAEGGRIVHHRLTKELQKSERKSHSRAAAGAKGGAARSLKNKEQREAIASGLPKHLPDTITREEKRGPIGPPKKPVRATRLPDDFHPDAGWAISAGLSRSEAETEAAKFRDYWTSKSGQNATKTDWSATWRNWVRSALERRPRPQAASPPGDMASYAGDLLRTMRRDDERDQHTGPTIDAGNGRRDHPAAPAALGFFADEGSG